MNKNLQKDLDIEMVERKFKEYPGLDWIVLTGTVSLKATRELLNIDRYECHFLYLDLLEAGAIYGSGSNCYRATPKLKEYMMQRGKHNEAIEKN